MAACRCNLEAAFEKVKDLRREASRWHPDRFNVCAGQRREAFRKMAREVSVVVDAMWRKAEEAAKKG